MRAQTLPTTPTRGADHHDPIRSISTAPSPAPGCSGPLDSWPSPSPAWPAPRSPAASTAPSPRCSAARSPGSSSAPGRRWPAAGASTLAGGSRPPASAWASGCSSAPSVVDYGTSLADLALMGALTGLVLGPAQALALPAAGPPALGLGRRDARPVGAGLDRHHPRPDPRRRSSSPSSAPTER